MPKAELKAGRQIQEIGAVIVGAWLKVLPVEALRIVNQISDNPLTIEVERSAFSAGDLIRIKPESGDLEDNIKWTTVGTASNTGNNSQILVITDLNGQIINYAGTSFANGTAISFPDLVGIRPQLQTIFDEITATNVNVLVDEPGQINIVVPMVPDGVLTREDLFLYLRDYHRHSQGRHYHDELGGAVLFGCR